MGISPRSGDKDLDRAVATAGLMQETPEAIFVIDGVQRVVQWSNAAAVTLGVPEGTALGRPCYEAVRGYDPFGRPVCRADCPAFKTLKSGHLTSSCSLLLPNQNGSRKRFVCDLVALPEFPGGAVATLSEHRQRMSASAAATRVSSQPWGIRGSAAGLVRDLAVLAALSTSLSPERPEQSVEQALDWLCQATDAEAAELFLVEPRGRDMLLTAHRGPFKTAFSQICRFRPGEGFPGLAQSQGQPIVTRRLPDDPRYLRTRVKEKGFHSYVCVPLFGPGGVIGVLNVADRSPDLDLERALRLLTWACRPLSTVLQAGRLQNKEAIGFGPAQVLPDAERNFDGLLRDVLRQMMLVGNAVGGALLLYDPNAQGLARRVTEGQFAEVVCPDVREGNPHICPAVVGGHGMALYGPRHRWPAPCQHVPAGAAMVYCLPLTTEGQSVGTVQLGYHRRPSPPTKHLASLLDLAERASQVIKHAWDNLNRQQLALSGLSGWKQELKQEMAQGLKHGRDQTSYRRPDSEELGRAPHAFLDIRCFGAFELYRQGKLVTPDMFQRRKTLTLLKILLTRSGHPVPRDALVEFLWPEADPRAGANRLYVLVHALRRIVEPAQQGHHWRYICNDGDHYYFNAEAPYRLDIKEFREHVNLGRRRERNGNTAAGIDAYEKVVSLYRGDLLEEEPYAEWCWGEREHLREEYLDVLRKLAAFYLEQGLTEKGVELYRLALRSDPLREEMHRGLMRGLWAAGRRDEALVQYQLCQDILLRELGVAPLPETERLHLSICHDISP